MNRRVGGLEIVLQSTILYKYMNRRVGGLEITVTIST